MKTARLISAALTICIVFPMATHGQSATQRGVSPIYIPGTGMDDDYATRSIKTFKSASSIKSTNGSRSGVLPSSTINAITPDGSGYSGGVSGGCNSGCGCESNCGCDQVGQSFFGRLRENCPIKFNVNTGGSSCGGDCGCGDDCDGSCDCPTGLARFLPVSIRIRSNHCSRYFSVYGGYVDVEDFDGPDGAGGSRLISFNDGWSFGVARGKRFANNIRTENEMTLRHFTNDTYSEGSFVGPDFVPTATYDAIDSLYSFSTSTNVLYDFNNFGTKTVPYVGFGVGATYLDGDVVTPDLGRTDYVNEWALAYQFIAGVTRKISCQTESYLEYRYMGTSGFNFATAMGPNIDDEFDFQNNNVVFGLRYTIPNSGGDY